MPSSRGCRSSYDCIVKIKGVTTRPILFSQLMRSDGEGAMNPEELFADDRSPASDQERVHEDELRSLMRSILDWTISFLSESCQDTIRAIYFEGKTVKQHSECVGHKPQARTVARRVRPCLPDGRPRQGESQAGLLPVLFGEEEARGADKARLALGSSARKERGCSYSSVKRNSSFRWAFLAMLTQALPGLRSPPAVRLRTEPCPS